MKFKPNLGSFIELMGFASVAGLNSIHPGAIAAYLCFVQLPLMFGVLITNRVKWLPKLDILDTPGKIINKSHTYKILDKCHSKALASLSSQGFTDTPGNNDIEKFAAMILTQGIGFYENQQVASQSWKPHFNMDFQFLADMLANEIQSKAIFSAVDNALMDYQVSIKFGMLTQNTCLLPSNLISNFKLNELEIQYMKSMLVVYGVDVSNPIKSSKLIEINSQPPTSLNQISKMSKMIKLIKTNFYYAAKDSKAILRRLSAPLDTSAMPQPPFKEYLSANRDTPAYNLLMVYFDTISRYFEPEHYKSYVEYKTILEDHADLNNLLTPLKVSPPSHTSTLKSKI